MYTYMGASISRRVSVRATYCTPDRLTKHTNYLTKHTNYLPKLTRSVTKHTNYLTKHTAHQISQTSIHLKMPLKVRDDF